MNNEKISFHFRDLEPFIARYVKTALSVGVIVIGSCDGNHPRAPKAFFQFGDIASTLWHRFVIQQLTQQLEKSFDSNVEK